MVIYEPLVAKDYEWINCCDNTDYEVFLGLDGSPRFDHWKPVKVLRVRADENQAFKPSDFPWLGAHAFVMRKKAVEALEDILKASGEVLPLATNDDMELFVFNVHTLDALDERKSLILKFPGTERIMRIMQVAFVESVIGNVDIFRLPHRSTSTYVSQRFVDRYREMGLVGLEFHKVWSTEVD